MSAVLSAQYKVHSRNLKRGRGARQVGGLVYQPGAAVAETRFDVLCIGNAIVDVLARVEDSFLGKHGLTKGAMRLIDEPTADQLYADMGPATEISGGSAGNTAAGIASFGGRAAYFGKVKNDQL